MVAVGWRQLVSHVGGARRRQEEKCTNAHRLVPPPPVTYPSAAPKPSGC